MASGEVNNKPSKSEALWIWQSDEGYKKIQHFLNPRYPLPRFLSKTAETFSYENKTYDIGDVVSVIKDAMKPAYSEETYYRGSSPNFKERITRPYPNFISVTSDRKQAESFKNGNCCLYELTIDPSVKRVNTGVEEEILLQDNVIGEVRGEETLDGKKVIKIHISVSETPPEEPSKSQSNSEPVQPSQTEHPSQTVQPSQTEQPSLEQKIQKAIEDYKQLWDSDNLDDINDIDDLIDDLIKEKFLILEENERETAKGILERLLENERETAEGIQKGGRKHRKRRVSQRFRKRRKRTRRKPNANKVARKRRRKRTKRNSGKRGRSRSS
jgi:hypothetical protein